VKHVNADAFAKSKYFVNSFISVSIARVIFI